MTDVSRRTFLSGTLAVGAAAAVRRARGAAHAADFDFDGAAASCGWRATAPGAFYFLHATDLHMTENPAFGGGALQMKDKFMGHCFIDDINALAARPSRPACLFLTGDLTSHTTMSSATWPGAERRWAHYRRYVTDRLQVPWRQFIGNNDCAAVPYRKIYPERPLWWSFERDGILFAGLHGYSLWKPENTNHAGILYDDAQLAWLRGIVARSAARTLVVLTHEPLKDADSHCARRQLAPILDLFRGEAVWNVAGHNHVNNVCRYPLGRHAVTSVETLTPVGAGFRLGDGGYRLFYARDGRICGSSLRWLTVNGDPIGYAPDGKLASPPPHRLLEETLPREALATALVGRDPFDAAGSSRIENRIADYYICRPNASGAPGRLVWRLPRTVGGVAVKRVQVFCGTIEGTAGVSADGVAWRTQPVAWARHAPARILEIPADFRGDDVWLSLANTSRYECKFFGYAAL